MYDRRIEHAVQKEAERIKRILRSIPSPVNHTLNMASVNRMFDLAERRARITVMARGVDYEEPNSGD